MDPPGGPAFVAVRPAHRGRGHGGRTGRRRPRHPRQTRLPPPGLARRAELEEYLTGHIRAVLRLGDGTVLDPQTPLKSLGFDSLLSLELRTRLEAGLDIRIAGDFVYQHPTLAALAAGLAGHMGLSLEEHTES
nr:acyl carrier protein [Streptomyces sp. I6]